MQYGKVPKWGNSYGICVTVFKKKGRPRHAEFTLQNGRYLEAHYDNLKKRRSKGKTWWRSEDRQRGVRLKKRKARIYWGGAKKATAMRLPRISKARWIRICPGIV